VSLRDDLLAIRRRTLSLVEDLEDWTTPRLPIVNPFGWEVGHVGWFQERWVLREALGRPPLRADGDALWDSSTVPHDTRWDLPLPDRAGTLAYVGEVLERVLEALEGGSPEVAYHARYAMLHEAMHAEAFTYMRQTLGWSAPLAVAAKPAGGPFPGDVSVPGGAHRLGAEPGAEWAFDNEKWAHSVELAPFRIARAQVTQAEYLAFVADGGYRRRELWHPDAPVWEGPVYWRDGGRRDFDQWVPIEPDRPMTHVSWFEADAWARWAGRRLPTEVEWDRAASGASQAGSLGGRHGGTVDVGAFPESDSVHGCRQMLGNSWEWTATVFGPFPGFVADPYADYSAPWFGGTHRVLRGGAWASSTRLVSATYRNFFPPHRRDVIAGFRTCAA
jgi:gamma-glutamyl hercynylcysteine S-oxide synthase